MCAYCQWREGHQTDHLITKNQARRRHTAASARNDPRFKVPCCSFCNQAKGTRLRVPGSHAHLIPELEALTGGVYAVWDGSLEALREVVR